MSDVVERTVGMEAIHTLVGCWTVQCTKMSNVGAYLYIIEPVAGDEGRNCGSTGVPSDFSVGMVLSDVSGKLIHSFGR